jgi:hypothetical protein
MQFLTTLTSFWPHMLQVLDTNFLQQNISFFQFNSSGLFNGNATAQSYEFVKRSMLHTRTPHGSAALRTRVHVAHGVLATTAIVLLFPTVAIILRVIASPHIIRLHWILQLCNLGVLLIAFSLGCWLSWLDGWVSPLA